MRAVIMAGGRGTRIAPVAGGLPKPMLPIGGKPVLEHIIEGLRRQSVTDILITVGPLGDLIEAYFGDGSGRSPATGDPFGVRIRYFREKSPLGSAGALYCLKKELDRDFLVLNGDIFFDVDLARFAAYHRKKGGEATLLTHPNSHPYDSSLIAADENGAVTQWLSKGDDRPICCPNRVNAGVHILSPVLLKQGIPGQPADLDRTLLKPLAGTGKLFAYDTAEYVKDMGTPERWQAVCDDVAAGLPAMRSLRAPRKAVFLDRDGTLNRYMGFLTRPEELELLPGVTEAIRRIHAAGYLAVIVTNQPVVARGDVSIAGLRQIHNRLEMLLGKEGAFVDGIFFCPHHPDRGFPGERPEMKITCACRKPKPGLLLQAADALRIDLSRSWMVGDSMTDVMAGAAAGCRTVLLGKADGSLPAPTVTADSLLDFVHGWISPPPGIARGTFSPAPVCPREYSCKYRK